jgi:two-component system, NtrC family, response regulator AtoC
VETDLSTLSVKKVPGSGGLISVSPAMRKIDAIIERIAPTDLGILITGETGVGKEVIARKIYQKSLRRDHPFIKVNSAAIPDSLIESELYGYHRGAFTGADNSRAGRIEEAHMGTLFFDEIGELNIHSQSKLLHMIQDGEFHPLGSNEPVRVDIRILAATNRDLYEEVEKGTFREDLFYRLNIVHIDVPPLRKRREDIVRLLEYFVETYSRQFGKKRPDLKDNHFALVKEYHWPGNVRELENFVKNLVLFDDWRASMNTLKSKMRDSQRKQDSDLSLVEMAKLAEAEVERRVIERTLKRNGWNRKETARMLRISYRSLLSKMKKLEIE